MTDLNIKAGDIGETDAENDKAIAKLERQEANKSKRISAARGKNSAKNSRQNKLALVTPVVLDGNQQVATGKTAAALMKDETKKTAKTKAAKEVKPKATKTPATAQYLSNDVNARGKTLLSPELVVKVFADKSAGMKNGAIAEKYNISPGSVSTILSGPEWFRSRMTRYGGLGWVYPTRAEKATEKKAGE